MPSQIRFRGTRRGELKFTAEEAEAIELAERLYRPRRPARVVPRVMAPTGGALPAAAHNRAETFGERLDRIFTILFVFVPIFGILLLSIRGLAYLASDRPSDPQPEVSQPSPEAFVPWSIPPAGTQGRTSPAVEQTLHSTTRATATPFRDSSAYSQRHMNHAAPSSSARTWQPVRRDPAPVEVTSAATPESAAMPEVDNNSEPIAPMTSEAKPEREQASRFAVTAPSRTPPDFATAGCVRASAMYVPHWTEVRAKEDRPLFAEPWLGSYVCLLLKPRSRYFVVETGCWCDEDGKSTWKQALVFPSDHGYLRPEVRGFVCTPARSQR